MVIIFVLGISVILQFVAAYLSLRLVRITGGRMWILVALATLLMAARRSHSFFAIMKGNYHADIDTEIVALIISILMVAGMAQVNQFFLSIKKSKEKLRISEANYRTIFNSANDAIILQDIKTGDILDVNLKLCEMYGYTSKEIHNLKPGKNVSGEPPCLLEDILQRVKEKAQEKSQLFECLCKDKNNNLFWIEANLKQVIINEKECLLTIIRDITLRKKAEEILCNVNDELERRVTERTLELAKVNEALRESESRYRVLFNNVNDAVFVHGVTSEGTPGNFIEVNDVACKTLGYTRRELLKLSPVEIRISKESYKLSETMKKLLSQKHALFESMHRTKSGEKIPVEVNSHLFNLNGEPTILSIARNISERKRAEKMLRNALEESKKRETEISELFKCARAILEYREFKGVGQVILKSCKKLIGVAYGYICLKDSDGYVNEVVAIQPKNSIDSTEFWLSLPFNDVKYEAYRYKKPVYCNNFTNSKWNKPAQEGRLNIDNVVFVPMIVENQILGFLCLFNKPGGFTKNDIQLVSTLGELAAIAFYNSRLLKSLKNMITELRHTQNIVKEKEKFAIIGQIAAGMAHEIKNPLTAIRGLAYLIRKNFSGNEVLASHMNVILKEADQANNTITKFLEITQPKQLSLKLESVNSIVGECIELLDLKFTGYNIRLEYKGAEDLPQCMLDREQLKQVILNMCQNAIEAMADGGVLKIKTGLETDKNEVYIEIKDTGCGIPVKQIKNIGVPFYTTKADAMGLGLSTSYAVVNAHKGRIEVDSTVGKGTRFSIYLPCCEAATE